MKLRLSILDQSPVVDDIDAATAIGNTMDLVLLAEREGYHRYWFAEHHGGASFASATPELMMAYAAARTSTIRLGSGGILLGHAASLKVAETLRSLEALAPGRIDAGFGRAPGGDGRVARALQYTPVEAMTRLDEVLRYLRDGRQPSQDGDVVAVPDGVGTPEVWMLGTSPDSALAAARAGLRYAFGAFIDPTRIDASMAAYWNNFVPSVWCAEPTTMIATVAFCADTDAAAQDLARSSEEWFVQSFLRGRNTRFPSKPSMTFNDHEQAIAAMRRTTVHIGTGAAVSQAIEHLARRYAASEVAVVTITARHEDRRRSYGLLMAAHGSA